MFASKIRNRESGILLYGITPPKIHTPSDKILLVAEKTMNMLAGHDIDALVVYDVQDESARTPEERPFPFVSALDPFHFASQYLHKISAPKIIYRPAGQYSGDELRQWLDGLRNHSFHPVFVGLPSPDFVVKTSLKEAYEIWRSEHEQHSVMGAVMIPERHALLNDEQHRILDKTGSGVSYFISQCVFEVGFAKKVLEDLSKTCASEGREVPTLIFTLTICGSEKTLRFMEWLGIHIPSNIKDELCSVENPVRRSIEIATAIARELIAYCSERGIPFGFNIESVAIRKEEIDASLELLGLVRTLLVSAGVRKHTIGTAQTPDLVGESK